VRDLLFRFNLTPKPKFPILTDGVLARGAEGKPVPEAGTLPAHGRVAVDGQTMRFDEHAGFGFTLVSRGAVMATLPDGLRTALQAVGVREVVLGVQREQVQDVDGVYGHSLDALGADVMLIRPDFVLYGCATTTHVQGFLLDFLGRLHHRSTAGALRRREDEGQPLTPTPQAAS
jgi:3-(3-hydroxy-phenyl)propionate hydroxylase